MLCRNHFVRGSCAGFDYAKVFIFFAFLANTLEFVLAISDLLELGWSFQKWCERGFGMTIEFSNYVINYKVHLTELEVVLVARPIS